MNDDQVQPSKFAGVRDRRKFLRVESKCTTCDFETFDTCNDHGSRFFSRIADHCEETGHSVDVKTRSEVTLEPIPAEVYAAERAALPAIESYETIRRQRRRNRIVAAVVVFAFGMVAGQLVDYLRGIVA